MIIQVRKEKKKRGHQSLGRNEVLKISTGGSTQMRRLTSVTTRLRAISPRLPLLASVLHLQRATGDNRRQAVALIAAASAAIALSLTTDRPEHSLITHCEGREYGRDLSSNFVADAIEMVAPAVVNIMSYVDGLLVAGISTGSGFIITEDGFVVTNAHVISSSTNGKVLVTTQNGVKRTGTVHSMDTQSDIALVKIDSEYMGEKFPIVSMGSSSKVRAGEFVVALGSPMQLQNSASFGIVSATARHASELGFANNRAEYIQTDAAINQGNSGGPLINIAGQVIGINVMKAKGVDGISFAIPVDTASHVIKQLMVQKRVIRPYVGMKVTNYLPARTMSAQSAQATTSQSQGQQAAPRSWWGNGGEKETKKRMEKDTFYDTQKVLVLVEKVAPGSPADRCGVKSGDFITAVDGKAVTGMRDVLDAVGLEVGKTIEMKLQRGGAGAEVTVYLTTAPETSKS